MLHRFKLSSFQWVRSEWTFRYQCRSGWRHFGPSTEESGDISVLMTLRHWYRIGQDTSDPKRWYRNGLISKCPVTKYDIASDQTSRESIFHGLYTCECSYRQIDTIWQRNVVNDNSGNLTVIIFLNTNHAFQLKRTKYVGLILTKLIRLNRNCTELTHKNA